MDFASFKEWLIAEKGITVRTASDIPSRLRRIVKLLGTSTIDSDTYTALKGNLAYKQYSVTVRSQMKRAITLYLEYVATKQ